MTPRPLRNRLTDGELEIMEVLWELGPVTVRQVHEALQARRDEAVGYTTVLKLMQIMHTKGWLERDTTARSHIYAPCQEAAHTKQGLVTDLIDRVFAGSASQLVLSALSNKRASAAELAEIRALLSELEEGGER